jgi:hypothetical protein
MGIGLGGGSAALNFAGETTDRLSGTGGSFRLGYVFNPKFALGFEGNTWFKSGDGYAVTLGTFTAAVTFFPTQGLVLRGGIGGGDVAAAGEGLSADVGLGWTAGVAYELRVARSFAIGPQVDYGHVNLETFDRNFLNVGLSMNWYFIPN